MRVCYYLRKHTHTCGHFSAAIFAEQWDLHGDAPKKERIKPGNARFYIFFIEIWLSIYVLLSSVYNRKKQTQSERRGKRDWNHQIFMFKGSYDKNMRSCYLSKIFPFVYFFFFNILYLKSVCKRRIRARRLISNASNFCVGSNFGFVFGLDSWFWIEAHMKSRKKVRFF